MNQDYMFRLILLIILCCIYLLYDRYISNNKSITLEANLKKLGISNHLLIARDEYLIKLLNDAIFLRYKSPDAFAKMILYIEDFIVLFETLKQNITNIYLNPNQMIQPDKISQSQRLILLNDLRDQLERVMKHIESTIHVIPNESIYIDSYYNFYQLIRNQLSRYYNRILSMYKINDHTSQYQLLRTSENKYDFIDNI